MTSIKFQTYSNFLALEESGINITDIIRSE